MRSVLRGCGPYCGDAVRTAGMRSERWDAIRTAPAAQQVCHNRQKDTVITKCFHIFCGQCIKANLDTRHRKCPGCGAAFGAGDIHSIFL